MILHPSPCVVYSVMSMIYPTLIILTGRLSTQSRSCPLAQNSHSDQSNGHGTESGEHFISLGIPQRSINKVGGQELEGRVQLKCQPRITERKR